MAVEPVLAKVKNHLMEASRLLRGLGTSHERASWLVEDIIEQIEEGSEFESLSDDQLSELTATLSVKSWSEQKNSPHDSPDHAQTRERSSKRRKKG